jgi:ATP-binding cassette subfamily F protein 3
MAAMAGEAGKCWRHPNFRVAYIAQHHVEQLADHLECTPVRYLLQLGAMGGGGGGGGGVQTERDARQFLGGFGLAGDLALQRIGTLSGGQKARLVFATAMMGVGGPPHVLVLDEPTNHLDKDSLESLAAAVAAFEGAVVMVSHNRQFMESCAMEMWTVAAGRVVVEHATEDTPFGDLFEAYKTTLRTTATTTKKKK